MKIRNGFVSNSSSSSFVVVMLPENFDPEVYIDYINEKQRKNKKKTYGNNAVSLLRMLMKSGKVWEEDQSYYDLYEAVYPLKIYDGETTEGAGYIELANKRIFDRITKINTEFEIEKMKAATIQIKEKREKMKMKYKHIDPYGEEDWEEEEDKVEENLIVKKYNSFLNE